MFCEKCGTELPMDAKFCEKCGASLEPGFYEKGEKHSNIKWIFLGIAGGIVVVAVVVLVLFATGVFGGGKENIQTSSMSSGADTGLSEPVTSPSEQPTATPTATPTVEPTFIPTSEPTEEPTMDSEIAMQDETEEDAEISDVSMGYLQSVTATSELAERNIVHTAERICDGKLKNAWVEGVSGQGIGEEVTFDFDDSYSFSGLKIHAGYQKNKGLYYKNSRPKKIRITFSDNSSITVKLKDYYGAQKVNFNAPIAADQVTVTVESVYKGNKYKDTVISELEWY